MLYRIYSTKIKASPSVTYLNDRKAGFLQVFILKHEKEHKFIENVRVQEYTEKRKNMRVSKYG